MKAELTKKLQRAQVLLFSLVIFLIPANLFVKALESRAYVFGILVDYLLPKFYLSDIPALLLLMLWLIESMWTRRANQKNRSKKQKGLLLLGIFALFAVVHLFVHRSSPYIWSTVWFLAKILEMGMLAAWVVAHHRILALQNATVKIALITMLCFQSALGMYQYVTQRPFFGYWFFGEPNLNSTATVAKTERSGALRVLPYGTTAHPNILAGTITFAFLGFILLSLPSQQASQKKSPTLTLQFTLLFSLAAFMSVLTESAATTLALVMGTVMHVLLAKVKKKKALAVPLVAFGVGLLIFIPLSLSQNTSLSPSLLRRQQLQNIALRMFAAGPLFGAGLNQFTTAMNTFGTVTASLRFFQPVHNVPLLVLAETSVFGLAFLILFSCFAHKYYSSKFEVFAILGIPLILILSLDHYLFSVQSGQLTSAIFIGFLLEKRKK